ncbi:hypothetical protein FRB95_001606 [Tulasnella sp. JGI-2019a]|nr:hypothetical protein FRB95_001606 [Tulasnella sp. JGI-2019a]
MSLPTMRGLRALAQFCPELEALAVSFDARDSPDTPHGSYSSTKLMELEIFGTAGTMSAEDVVVSLSDLWPTATAQLGEIGSERRGIDQEDVQTSIGQQKAFWKEVVDGLAIRRRGRVVGGVVPRIGQ